MHDPVRQALSTSIILADTPKHLAPKPNKPALLIATIIGKPNEQYLVERLIQRDPHVQPSRIWCKGRIKTKTTKYGSTRLYVSGESTSFSISEVTLQIVDASQTLYSLLD